MKRWCLLIFGLFFLIISGVGILLLRDVYGGSAPDAGGAPFTATSVQIASLSKGAYLPSVLLQAQHYGRKSQPFKQADRRSLP